MFGFYKFKPKYAHHKIIEIILNKQKWKNKQKHKSNYFVTTQLLSINWLDGATALISSCTVVIKGVP